MEEQEENHYEPGGKPERLATRAKIPRQPLGLNKRAILVLTCSCAAIIGLLFLSGLSPRKEQKAYTSKSNWNPHPSEAVQGLPDDYDEMERRRTAEDKKQQFQKHPVSKRQALDKRPTQEEKILAEYEISRLKDAIKARGSDLSFRGIGQELGRGATTRASLGGHVFGSDSGGSSSGEAAAFNNRDADNRQDEKQSFLERQRSKDTHLSASLKSPTSKYELMAGTVIPGLMLTGLNSDLPGEIMGQVSQNVYDSITGQYLLLPQGSKIVGLYDSKVTYGQERALVVWTRLILPNGKSLSLEGMPGVDMSGYAGLKDKVNNHYLRLLTGVVFGSLLGAGAQVAYGGYQNVNPEFGQLALQGAAQNINQAGQRITQKNLSVQPTLEIRPGLRFNIFVTKDITLEPYQG